MGATRLGHLSEALIGVGRFQKAEAGDAVPGCAKRWFVMEMEKIPAASNRNAHQNELRSVGTTGKAEFVKNFTSVRNWEESRAETASSFVPAGLRRTGRGSATKRRHPRGGL